MACKTILLVENEPLISVLTRMELENLGYEVESTPRGNEAIRLAETDRPDVVLMDFQLDGDMDGAQAAEEIQNRLKIPVIFLTGCSDTNNIQKCLATKPFGFIRKPCKNVDIQKAIEHAAFVQQLMNELPDIAKYPLHDGLTGLPTRRLLMKEIEKAQKKEASFAVLYIDIDRLKQINDGFGYDAGDQFLQLFAARLEALRRPGDCLARIGSDEFVIFMRRVRIEKDAVDFAAGIHKIMQSPAQICGEDIFASVRIGIVEDNTGYDNPEQILRDAESAMLQCREAGTSSTAVFDRQMHSRAIESYQLENDLRRAVDRDELAVYYQPIVQLSPYKIVGFEALLRWHHPELGTIHPTEIIPLAEKAGLMLSIGMWVLEVACSQLAEWNRIDPELCMHVNLSSKHLLQQNLISDIRKILDETGLQPSRLRVEITENDAIHFTESVLGTLAGLQSLNIGVEIDDFGKGYSSLSYLHHLPIDALKIDRSFIECVHKESESSEIVEMIVGLGKKLRLKVIAEGVETSAQLEQVQMAGCQLVQGYLFSPAVNAEQAGLLLADQSFKPFAA